MELSDLIAYAKEKYHIEEQHKWKDFPGFSVLCHPDTGKWVALLMRQWDTDTGTEIQRCDLKCGAQSLLEYRKPYLTAPVRMKGKKWIGVAFEKETEPEVVCKLFDRAVTSGDQRGYTVVLRDRSLRENRPGHHFTDTGLDFAGAERRKETQSSVSAPQTRESFRVTPEDPAAASEAPQQITWKDVSLPFPGERGRGFQDREEKIPERIRQMRRLYDYGRNSVESRAKNFFRQAKFMEDYDDDAPWKGGIVCYFPTYHDLTTRQLRGYFAWRTDVRSGIYRPIATSAAYIYVYELLNGIGAVSPEDSLQKLDIFIEKYIDSGIGDSRMRSNVMRWAMELAIISGLPPASAREYMDPDLLERDTAMITLRNPSERTDDEIIQALCYFGGKKQAQSPVLTAAGEKGRYLFAEAWKTALKHFRQEDKDLFTACFGKPVTRRWYPLSNAVYYQDKRPEDIEYTLDACRTYICKDGAWLVKSFEKLTVDRDRIRGFLHTADLLLRRYLKTGRYLREKPEENWAVPFVQMVIQADEQAVIEAARPKITIDFSGLEKIRQDALVTQNSLLTEEEQEQQNSLLTEEEQEQQNSLLTEEDREPTNSLLPEEDTVAQDRLLPEDEKATAALNSAAEPQIPDAQSQELPEQKLPEQDLPESQELPDIPLDPVQIRILQMLLQNDSPDTFIREQYLMPSIVADTINEALFDEIGDAVLACDEDRLSLVEDYIEEIEELLGGIQTT